MSTPGDKEAPLKDDETRQRSAEQRNVTLPTPRDVRDKAKAKEGDEREVPTEDTS